MSDASPSSNSPEPVAAPDPALDVIEVSRGEALSISEVGQLLRSIIPTTVALVGEPECGKTTLIATLYEAFQKGPFAGFALKSSRTLVGFDKRHHLARLSSERRRPATPRTGHSLVTFCHLGLKQSRDKGIVKHLLLADRKGETYQKARSDTSLVPDLDEFKQADRVVILVDGSRIADIEQRPGHRRNVLQLMRTLADNGAWRSKPAIEIMTTKMDLIDTSEKREEILEILTEYEQKLRSVFEPDYGSIVCSRIAALPIARPEMGVVGLDDILKRWLSDLTGPDLTLPPLLAPNREIDRLRQVSE